MKCPNCGNELEDGKLLCENCGEEVKIVPDFDIELEDKLTESISAINVISVMEKEIADESEGSIEDGIKDGIEDETKDKPEAETKNKSEDADVQAEYEFEDDIKDKLSDYMPKEIPKLHINKKLAIAAVCIFAVICISVIATVCIKNYRSNSFDYQYNKAIVCASENDYQKAAEYLERALAIEPENLDVRFLLAKYYDKNGQHQSTISLLKEMIDLNAEYAKRDEVYDMLLGIYEADEDYDKMGELLKACDIPRIVSKYNKYAALKPEFNKQGGNYDEVISISLAGNAPGFVYYTTDGTTPTDNSQVYETPILLESGSYTIRAMFVNMYGIQSDVETQHYYVSLSVPDSPVISPDSGNYSKPSLIEAYHDISTKVYYTTDGSVPDKNSNRYTDPIEMPYGISNFSFISIDESGLGSEVVNRTYHLEITTNFDTELAVQVLKNNLWAAGKLANVDGNVPNKLGLNLYKVRTLFETDNSVYYIVYEEYMDTLGKTHDTNNIYAIDANTADLYKAYKVDEGKYNLQPFDADNTF